MAPAIAPARLGTPAFRWNDLSALTTLTCCSWVWQVGRLPGLRRLVFVNGHGGNVGAFGPKR